MALTTELKQIVLRKLARDATANGLKLLDAIWAYADARVSGTNYGFVVQTTAANGHSISFRINVPSDRFTHVDFTEYAAEMLTRYDSAVTYLGGTPDDPSILTEILAHLIAATESTSDYTQLRYATGSTVI